MEIVKEMLTAPQDPAMQNRLEAYYTGESGQFNRAIKAKPDYDQRLKLVREVEELKRQHPEDYGNLKIDYTLLKPFSAMTVEEGLMRGIDYGDKYSDRFTVKNVAQTFKNIGRSILPDKVSDLMEPLHHYTGPSKYRPGSYLTREEEARRAKEVRELASQTKQGRSILENIAATEGVPDSLMRPGGTPPEGLDLLRRPEEAPVEPAAEPTLEPIATDDSIPTLDLEPLPAVPTPPPPAIGLSEEYKKRINAYRDQKGKDLGQELEPLKDWSEYTGFPIDPETGSLIITDEYRSDRGGGEEHTGIDIRARVGTPLVAPFDLYIDKKKDGREGVRGGNYIVVTNVYDGSTHKFMHLDSFESQLPSSKAVKRLIKKGTTIAYTGNSGIKKDGSPIVQHLHWEVRDEKNKLTDPKGYMPGDGESDISVSYKSAESALVQRVSQPLTPEDPALPVAPSPPGTIPPVGTFNQQSPPPLAGTDPFVSKIGAIQSPHVSAASLAGATGTISGAPEFAFQEANRRVGMHDRALKRELEAKRILETGLAPEMRDAKTLEMAQRVESERRKTESYQNAVANIKASSDKAVKDIEKKRKHVENIIQSMLNKTSDPWSLFSAYEIKDVKDESGRIVGKEKVLSPSRTAFMLISAIGLVGNAFESYKTRNKKTKKVPFVALDLIKTALDLDLAKMNQSLQTMGDAAYKETGLMGEISKSTRDYAVVQAELAKQGFLLASQQVAEKAEGSTFGALILKKAEEEANLKIQTGTDKTKGELIKAHIEDANPKDAKDAYSLMSTYLDMLGAQREREAMAKSLKEAEPGMKAQIDAAKKLEDTLLDSRRAGFYGLGTIGSSDGSSTEKNVTADEREGFINSRQLIKDLLEYKEVWERWKDKQGAAQAIAKYIVANQNSMPILGTGGDEAKDANQFKGWMKNLDWAKVLSPFGYSAEVYGQMVNDFAFLAWRKATMGARLKKLHEQGSLNIQEGHEGRSYLPLEAKYDLGIKMIDDQINRLLITAHSTYWLATRQTQERMKKSLESGDFTPGQAGDAGLLILKNLRLNREEILNDVRNDPRLSSAKVDDGRDVPLPAGTTKFE